MAKVRVEAIGRLFVDQVTCSLPPSPYRMLWPPAAISFHAPIENTIGTLLCRARCECSQYTVHCTVLHEYPSALWNVLVAAEG